MRKRIICALLALSCITMMISGCTPDATVQTTQNAFETQEDGITIQMLHIWPEHEDAMEKLVEAIEEKNTGLSVQISTTDWSSLSQTLETALAAEEMYDVFVQFASRVHSMEKENKLLNLTPYMDDEWKEGFQPGALKEYTVEDDIYGIPFRGSGVVVIYNQDLFNRNGWKKPSSTDEFSALMQLMLNEGLIPLSAAGKPDGFQLDSLRGILTNYIAEQDGVLDDPERLNGRKTNWQGELATGAQKVKNWAEKGFFGANPLSVDQYAAADAFLSGKAAMLLCNTNEIYQLRNQPDYLPFNMDCFLIPAPKDCTESLFTDACFQDGFAVWADTPYPDAAVALLKGLSDSELCGQWAQDTLSVSAVRDVQCDDEMVNEFNAFFRMAGRYRIAPDYALGDSDEQKSQLFVSYMTSNMTADEYETNYERITRNAIAASGK